MTDRTDYHAHVASYRGRYYVTLKSGVVQRWAASNLPVGKDYSTLNSTVWRKSGLRGSPNNASPAASGQTYYFTEVEDATNAAREFVSQLERKGVKI